MKILGIETSCDETAAAVVSEDGTVHSDVVRSQIAIHAPYGGVVPEIAARDHTRAVVYVVDQALREAHTSLSALDGVAVTARPGLSGALLVGIQYAKGLAWAKQKPLVAVDHLVGHLLAVFLRSPGERYEPPTFPFVALLASGGHTALYRVEGPDVEDIQELGATRDDAAGEAYDKAAKVLGLGYPGGPIIDKLALDGDAERSTLVFPRPMPDRRSYEFSFSGIKSSLARHVEANGPPQGEALNNLCAGFQKAVVGTLVRKTINAAHALSISHVVIGGGVAANRGLRAELQSACDKKRMTLTIPSLHQCTDNAAMIAYVGAQSLVRRPVYEFDRVAMSISPSTRTSLPRVTAKGPGRR